MFPLASNVPLGRVRAGRGGATGAFDAAPLLEGDAERLLAALLKSLGAMAGTTTTVEGALVGFRTVALRDHLATQRPGAVTFTLDCAAPACTALVTMDPALVHAVVELLCGGDGRECRPEEMRAATALDAQYAGTVVTLAAAAVASEWKERGFAGVKATRIEGTPSATVCGTATRTVGALTLAVAIFGLRGLLTLALPPAALDLFKDESVGSAPDPSQAGPVWATQLRAGVTRTTVKIDVLLDALPLSLHQLSQLRPGQILVLPPDAGKRASLDCDGRTLYRGEIGQEQNRYSIRIDEPAAAAGAAQPFRLRAHRRDTTTIEA